MTSCCPMISLCNSLRNLLPAGLQPVGQCHVVGRLQVGWFIRVKVEFQRALLLRRSQNMFDLLTSLVHCRFHNRAGGAGPLS